MSFITNIVWDITWDITWDVTWDVTFYFKNVYKAMGAEWMSYSLRLLISLKPLTAV